MKRSLICAAGLLSVSACGYQEGTFNVPSPEPRLTPEQEEIEKLKNQVLQLVGTVTQINNFIAGDFSSCSASLPAFERKVCQIAQTATAEQQIDFSSRLGEANKVFQEELFGVDCWLDYVDQTFNSVSCPATGSIMDRLDDVETAAADITTIQSDITDLQTDVSTLQTDVSTLQTDVSALETRLDDFNGSGNSIETVISGIETDLANLDTRVDDLEVAVSSAELWNVVSLCDDVTPDTGPNYEALLLQGDRSVVAGYLQASGGKRGLGVVWEAGDGDLYLDTTLNTLKCNFAIYEVAGEANICWNNANRNASNASIDTECDVANSLATPTADCTCK